MTSFMEKYIEKIFNIVLNQLPTLVIALIILIIGLWVVKRVALLAEKTMIKRDVDVSLRTFLKSLLSIGLKLVLIITVAGMVGIGTSSFVTVLGAAGLAVGLALQGSLANFAGGVLILTFKPFKVGDTIEAQLQVGTVEEIQIFNTLLLTPDYRLVVIPNGVLSNNIIVNISRTGIRRADIPLTLNLNSDIEKVKQILHDVMNQYEHILKTPEPIIYIGNISGGAIHISVRPYLKDGLLLNVTSDLNILFKNAFEENGIEQFIPRF